MLIEYRIRYEADGGVTITQRIDPCGGEAAQQTVIPTPSKEFNSVELATTMAQTAAAHAKGSGTGDKTGPGGTGEHPPLSAGEMGKPALGGGTGDRTAVGGGTGDKTGAGGGTGDKTHPGGGPGDKSGVGGGPWDTPMIIFGPIVIGLGSGGKVRPDAPHS